MSKPKPTIEQIPAASATHPELRAKLIADPRAALLEHGVEIRAGVEIRLVENTSEVPHLALPPGQSDELPGEQLAAASVGGIEKNFKMNVAEDDSQLIESYQVG